MLEMRGRDGGEVFVVVVVVPSDARQSGLGSVRRGIKRDVEIRDWYEEQNTIP